MQDLIKHDFQHSIQVKEKVIEQLLPEIEHSTKLMIDAFKSGKKLLVCGNGGSAADAQHFAAELIIRYEKDRKALPAIALTTNSSNLTAGANDLGYAEVFARKVEALGNEGDVLVGITTSGNSENIIKALKTAKQKGMKTICLNGKTGGKVNDLVVDSNIIIPADNTARIQESHITIIHSWCRLIEDAFVENAEKFVESSLPKK